MVLEAFAGLMGYAALIEPGLMAHRRFSIELPGLPEGWRGATIHFVTDIHCNRWTRMEARIQKALSEPADLILLGGDIIHDNAAVGHIRRILSTARSRHGVFGVLGNAERKGWVDTEGAVRDLEAIGVEMLANRHVCLERDNSVLRLVGVDDPYKGRPDLAAALPKEPGFRILLAHAPQILRDPLVQDVDLILAGHTHGGQVRLPFFGPLGAHSAFEFRWSAGLFPPERIMKAFRYARAPTLYVSKGIATGTIHFRFCCLPEIQTITLV